MPQTATEQLIEMFEKQKLKDEQEEENLQNAKIDVQT